LKKHLINRAIQKYIPNNLIMYKPDIAQAKKRFEEGSKNPVWLNQDTLEKLYKKYPNVHNYKYDLASLKKRGEVSAQRILKLLPMKTKPFSFLELGCHDGMTSCALHRKGYMTHAIDINPFCIDRRAILEGVKFQQMNAEVLTYPTNSMNATFSFNMFEHVNDPETVLKEMLRVTKNFGFVYLKFAPLYYSPNGFHISKMFPIPYCQFLFSENQILDFLGFNKDIFVNLNKWSLADYCKLWINYENQLTPIFYKEQLDISHVNLISKYPSCFKSKSSRFDNFLVTSVEILFQKGDIQK